MNPRSLVLVLVLVACGGGGSAKPAPPSNIVVAPVAASCATRAAELETYLADVWDLSAKPAPPWPSGDAATDKRIDEGREKVRKAMAPVDPSQRAVKLSDGIKPGPLEAELAPCQPALESLKGVGLANTTAEKVHAFTGIADAIGACDCNVNIPFVRAALYVLVRGPD